MVRVCPELSPGRFGANDRTEEMLNNHHYGGTEPEPTPRHPVATNPIIHHDIGEVSLINIITYLDSTGLQRPRDTEQP